MKYTLFCVRGKFLIPDRHFVILGSWLPYDRRYIILQHGILDKDLVSCFLEEKRIPVFLDHRYHTISIENSYNQIYQQRKPVEELQQFIGFLYMKKKRIFEGRLGYYGD